MAKRTTYKYNFKVGRKTVHTGITNNLSRRASEHRSKHGWGSGKIAQVGNRTTRQGALNWERGQRAKGKPTGP